MPTVAPVNSFPAAALAPVEAVALADEPDWVAEGATVGRIVVPVVVEFLSGAPEDTGKPEEGVAVASELPEAGSEVVLPEVVSF